jgi:tetratricopeptide (TPR) repeat protein
MTAGEAEQFARIAAIGAGIVFGGWALSSVIWVWTRKQIYAYGGSALSVVGIILMGLSIYKTIDVRAAPGGIGIKLAEVETLLKEQGQVQQMTQQKLAEIPAELGSKIVELDRSIKEQVAAQIAQLRTQDGDASIIQSNAAKESRSVPTSREELEFLKARIAAEEQVNPVNANDLTFSYEDIGALYQLKRQYQNAVDAYRKAIGAQLQINPKSPRLVKLYTRLGEALQATGQKADALLEYQRATELLKTLQ